MYIVPDVFFASYYAIHNFSIVFFVVSHILRYRMILYSYIHIEIFIHTYNIVQTHHVVFGFVGGFD